ncbi:glycosyltransferase family 4 protein [Eubacteriaceae bacterium ES3]|nr:glycosyltransferase family 4 protein [Eubacteriaceae bacterium ES3]
MKVMVISPKNKAIFNFRGDLIKEMIRQGHEVVATGPNQDNLDDILALGADFIEVPLVKDNTSIWGDLKYYQNLKKVFLKEKPDVVFAFTIKPVIYGSLAAKRAGVRKIYAMVTGLGRVYSSNSMKSKLLRVVTGILYKSAFKGCDRVIFQNDDDRMKFVNLKYTTEEKTVRVDGSGVNLQRFQVASLPNENIFLMIARIIKEKGVLDFAEAARIVKIDYPEACFILLGGYDKSIGAIRQEDLEPYISEGTIEFPGEVKDVVPYLKEARIFVLPSYYGEGLPRTILESMAMGRPVITTDWQGCRDAVENGVNGYLVKPRDPISLSLAMKKMIEEPQKAKAMGENGRKLCQEKYDVNLVNKHMLSIMGLIEGKS